ncbi:sensor histidine kinase [Ketobacter sp.]|uniref:sensor histidine kinase n=1 Tax=Ketobacter sp. TaxID=2083498 RepID=UPI000C59C5D1|nr:PAS domain-containing sensor histidine kinase [Ketobacter sp.]MBA53311.1 PAS domain-containing sensor histidine kinase [Pseudomonadales bacterium]RLT92570.1 MAG: GHKL domain-containing protein [Ketobacter sp.]
MRAVVAERQSSDNERMQTAGQPTPRDLQARLQTTFSAFSNISNQLTESYLDLEKRVDELQQELVYADKALTQELSAKQVLSERVELIVNIMPVAVILLDGRGVIVQANAIAESLFERPLLGERWITIINECFAPNPTDGHEIALKNGKLVSLATQSMKHEPGQIIALNDQTETRSLQNKLNHHRKLSEMGRMTASLAHQIRTPLSTAILYADHLASESLTEERRLRYADKLKSRLMQLEQQVRDMLIFSKGGVVLNAILPVFQLVSVFQAQVEDYVKSGRASVAFDDDIPAGSVRCNPELLSSVFSNLIDNAIEACEGEGIAPHIHVSTTESKGGLITFLISDNGPGIPEHAIHQIQEPFFTTKSTGTGLGLAVVKAVVESHGGQFSMSSNSITGGALACLALPQIQGGMDSEEAKQ